MGDITLTPRGRKSLEIIVYPKLASLALETIMPDPLFTWETRTSHLGLQWTWLIVSRFRIHLAPIESQISPSGARDKNRPHRHLHWHTHTHTHIHTEFHRKSQKQSTSRDRGPIRATTTGFCCSSLISGARLPRTFPRARASSLSPLCLFNYFSNLWPIHARSLPFSRLVSLSSRSNIHIHRLCEHLYGTRARALPLSRRSSLAIYTSSLSSVSLPFPSCTLFNSRRCENSPRTSSK